MSVVRVNSSGVVLQNRKSASRVRRNLFGGGSSDPTTAASAAVGSENGSALEWAALSEDQNKFRRRWGFDVNTDSATPDSPFDWQRLDFDELPDVFKRIGGTRPRRYSPLSTRCINDATEQLPHTLSSPSGKPLLTAASLGSAGSAAQSDGKSKAFIGLREASGYANSHTGTRSLITDYLASQLKRPRAAKNPRGARVQRHQRPLVTATGTIRVAASPLAGEPAAVVGTP